MHEPTLPAAATGPTVYFVGVTASQSSIMRVFPVWARELGVVASIVAVDLPVGAPPGTYRQLVTGIRDDPWALGAVVTAHKLSLYAAARDLFDVIGAEPELLGEVNAISKVSGRLRADATDPIACDRALASMNAAEHWRHSGADVLVFGAGGASLALTLTLHRRAVAGVATPTRIIVTDPDETRLAHMRSIHESMGMALPVERRLVTAAWDNDDLMAQLPPGSLVVNATGLGKDRPGSPISAAARFPEHGCAWDFNYRGDLLFLAQARAQADAAVRVVDGWDYFLHGWLGTLALVLHRELPDSGAQFDRLGELAAAVRG